MHLIRSLRKNIGQLPVFAERVAQLFQRPLFNARYIAARDAELFGDLALRQRCRQTKAVPKPDDLPLSWGKRCGERTMHGEIAVVLFYGSKTVVLAADDILQGQRVAVAIGFERVGQRKLSRVFPLLPEMHEQLVLNAFGSIGGQTDAFIRPEGTDCLNQPDGADGNQVILLGAGGIVFL